MNKADQIVRLAQEYSEAIQEFNALMSELGAPPVEAPAVKPAPSSTAPSYSTAHPGYQRITQTPGQDLQDIAQQILMQHHDEPFGTSVPFTHEGKNYLAVLEQHVGGRVPGPHPGISLFEQATGTAPPPVRSGNRNMQIVSGLDERLQPLAIRFLQLAAEQGIPLVLTQGYRSTEEQNRLYEQGRTTPGDVVTHVRGGKSKHNFGLAFDVAPVNDKGQPYYPNDEQLWQRIGQIGESLGLRWGGNWPAAYKDRPHFELSGKAQV
jgi:hypothetical protein